MTRRDYLSSNEMTGPARVNATGTDDRGFWIELDRTLFHPQGGGQPADLGTIDKHALVAVRAANEDIRHYLSSEVSFSSGQQVRLEVNEEARLRHARLHTGGHLIAAIAESQNPNAEAVAGHHWPGEARVEVINLMPDDRETFVSDLQLGIDEAIAQNLPVSVLNNKGRSIAIGPHRPVGCGGTHCTELSEIGALQILAVKVKGGKLRVRYDLA